MSFGMFTKARATNITGAACLALFNAGVAFAAPLLKAATDSLAESLDAANTTTTTPAPSPSGSSVNILEIVGLTLGIAALVGTCAYGMKRFGVLDVFCCEGDDDEAQQRRQLVVR